MLAKPNITKDLSRFCTSDKLSHQLSVDATFNFGKFEVTTFTYKHLFLKSKPTGKAPSSLGPTAIHYSQQKNVYKRIVLAVANSSRDLADRAKGLITDGEESLYNAHGEVMPHATGMRCFWHFQQNCCDKLRKQTEQKFFIHTVFGRPTSEGFLDAHNKSDLKAGILADTEEARLNGNESPGFWTYVHTHKMMMKKCMITTARIKVGMLNYELGKPLKSYTNQSESINNKLTHQKEDMAYNDKADMSKVQLTKNVWEEVDRHQQEELKLAICGISNE